MNKYSRYLVLVVASFVTSVLLYSCCTQEWLITGSGTLRIDGGLNPTEPLSVPFDLVNQFEAELVNEDFSKLSLINSAWATSCEYGLKNDVDMSSLSLSLDQDFMLDENLVSSGTNLLDLEEFSASLDLVIAGIFIQIDPSFFDNAILTKGEHTFVVKVDVDDDLNLESSLTLDFDF